MPHKMCGFFDKIKKPINQELTVKHSTELRRHIMKNSDVINAMLLTNSEEDGEKIRKWSIQIR